MADATRTTKVQTFPDKLVVASGGSIELESGASLKADGVDVATALDALAGIDTLGTPVNGVQATITLDSAPANSDLTLTAVEYGTSGHTLQAEIVQDTGNDKPLAVVVAGRKITIKLPTDAGGAPVAKTATEVKAAYDAVPAAVALATCAVQGTGAGDVDESALASFAGGVNVTAGAVPSFKVAAAGDLLFVKVSAQVWKKVALAAL